MRFEDYSLSSLLTALVVAALAALGVPPAAAQSVDTTKLAGIQPRALGPAGMSGSKYVRVHRRVAHRPPPPSAT